MSNRAEPLMTQAEVAEFLHVTQKTVRGYVARGLLPAYRIKGTRTTRYRRAEVEAMLVKIPTVGNFD